MIRGRIARAFTLIELLVVLVILAVLAAIVVPGYVGRVEKARRDTTIAEISNYKSALAAFEVDNGRFPATLEGLNALVQCPQDCVATWSGPYIESIKPDKWGREYSFTSPGIKDPRTYDLISAGKDGEFGTEDDVDKDTVN